MLTKGREAQQEGRSGFQKAARVSVICPTGMPDHQPGVPTLPRPSALRGTHQHMQPTHPCTSQTHRPAQPFGTHYMTTNNTTTKVTNSTLHNTRRTPQDEPTATHHESITTNIGPC
ncbi:hypothetical protein E2C01_011196 [Portunus trituberculatus]|uniref:Uncharacterized protein n=1 Tax=Portunus trituberculatus TaxID=210409 RepID=A0A5B7DAP3_PORTR|nr:hypothetical protein [Portunus trituberculatus]